METPQLVLEYFKVLLSWPLIAGGIVTYFLMDHRKNIGEILKRLSKISLPGGFGLDAPPPYIPAPEPPSEPTASPKALSLPDDPNKNFREFLKRGVILYKILSEQDINILWDQALKRPGFVLGLQNGQLTDTGAQKLLAMRMDERAIEDYKDIGKISKDTTLEELMSKYHRSIILHTYLSRQI